MRYDTEKILDFTDGEPVWKHRITLSAAELEELKRMAYDAQQFARTEYQEEKVNRWTKIGEAFRGLARILERRDLDSLEGFKTVRPLPVPAMKHTALDCE